MNSNPSTAVTFLDNHDTYRYGSKFQPSKIILGYVFILTHPGTPCVYGPHVDILRTWEADSNGNPLDCDYGGELVKTKINTLIELRSEIGITSGSPICSENGEEYSLNYYSAIVSGKYGKIAIHINENPVSAWNPSSSTYCVSESFDWEVVMSEIVENVYYCVWRTFL